MSKLGHLPFFSWKNGFKCSFISFAIIFPVEVVDFFLLLNLNHLDQIPFTQGWVIEGFKCLQCSFVSFYIIFPLEMGIFFLLNLNYLDQIPFTPGWIILNVNWIGSLLKREWKFWMAKMGKDGQVLIRKAHFSLLKCMNDVFIVFLIRNFSLFLLFNGNSSIFRKKNFRIYDFSI